MRLLRRRTTTARPKVSSPPPREGSIVEVVVPLSCFAFIEGRGEPSPAIVTQVFDPTSPTSCISCIVMEAGMEPELRRAVHYGYGDLQWHWPTADWT